jgi:putative tricarboxylic transport membrane protein
MYLEGEPFERELQAERERLVRVIARLRGPLRGTPVTAGERIMPIVVFTGAGLVLLSAALTWYRKRRTDGNRAPMPSTNRRAVAMMAAGLVAFVVLVEPMGFIIAATTLFVVTASAFRPALIRPAIVGAIFCALVYLAFTRGLDLLLPSGSLWAWMR